MYDELIERLHKRIALTTAGSPLQDVLREAADAIEELSHDYEKLAEDFNGAVELLHKREKPRWIPVTERLPEKNGSYLVYVYGEVTEMSCWHGKWHRLGDDYTKAVTHWMPLPEPPKEEDR